MSESFVFYPVTSTHPSFTAIKPGWFRTYMATITTEVETGLKRSHRNTAQVWKIGPCGRTVFNDDGTVRRVKQGDPVPTTGGSSVDTTKQGDATTSVSGHSTDGDTSLKHGNANGQRGEGGQGSGGKQRKKEKSSAKTACNVNKFATHGCARVMTSEFGAEDCGIFYLSQTFRVSDVIAGDFVSSAQKYAKHTGDFRVSDFSAIVEQLAKYLAVFTIDSTIDYNDLGGGNTPNVCVIGAMTSPLCATDKVIWLPQCANDNSSEHAFTALIYAATGVGSTVVTDRLSLDINNRAIIGFCGGVAGARGVLEALRIVGSQYNAANAGAIFALALMKGMNHVLSVVGHTDEGGLVRDVLRRCRFRPSFGGINTALRGWGALPQPVEGSGQSYICLVDNLILQGAATSAVADPCVVRDGRVYPTFICSRRGGYTKAGTASVGTVEDADEILATCYDINRAWSTSYITLLARCWCINFDDISSSSISCTATAVNALDSMWLSMLGTNTRHARYTSICPYFWVEPTGILKKSPYSTADQNGLGVLAEVDMPGFVKVFPNAQPGSSDAMGFKTRFEWRSARTVGLALHYNFHPRDGLANCVFTRCDAEKWAHTGDLVEPDVLSAVSNSRDLAHFMWKFADKGLCAPGEANYFGAGVEVHVRTVTFQENTYSMEYNGMVLPGNPDAEVIVRVSTLMGVVGKTISGLCNHVRRCRTTHVESLIRIRTERTGFFDHSARLFTNCDVSFDRGPKSGMPNLVVKQDCGDSKVGTATSHPVLEHRDKNMTGIGNIQASEPKQGETQVKAAQVNVCREHGSEFGPQSRKHNTVEFDLSALNSVRNHSCPTDTVEAANQ